MSKSFREKKSREKDVFEGEQNRKPRHNNMRRKDKIINNKSLTSFENITAD